MSKFIGLSIFTIAGALCCTQSTLAHSPNDNAPNALQQLVRQSSLILYGDVADIQYKNSEPTKEQPKGVPHTFVTYKVREFIRGSADEKTVVLRIPGGADGRGGVYLNTNAPTFARGQTDVLFVGGGKAADCHLVDCVEGRFRVVEERVYNGWGVPIVSAEKELRAGGVPRFDLNVMDVPRPSFEEVMQQPEAKKMAEKLQGSEKLDRSQLQARYEAEAPKYSTVKFGLKADAGERDQTENKEARPIEKFEKPITVEAFIAAIRKTSETAGRSRLAFVAADPGKAFTVADPVVATIKPATAEPAQISEEERNDKTQTGGRRQ